MALIKFRLPGLLRNLFETSGSKGGSFSESLRYYATTMSGEDTVSTKPRVSGASSVIRSRKLQLLDILQSAGAGAGNIAKLEYRVMAAISAGDLDVVKADIFILLARDRGETYARKVLSGEEAARPRRLFAISPANWQKNKAPDTSANPP